MRQRYICLSCKHTDYVSGEKKEDFQKVVPCPKCKEGAYVDAYSYATLPQKKNNAKGITIELDADMGKLTKKLRVIAKHAEALATELEAIDDTVCPECGDGMECTTMYMDGKVVAEQCTCPNCGAAIDD